MRAIRWRTRRARLRVGRRSLAGATLVELTVVMMIAGVLLALVVGIALKQQRVFGDLADATALEGRLREAIAILPVDLRALSPSEGDIREARDSSLEIRATIATGIVCDTGGTGGSRLVLMPASGNAGRYASYSTPIVVGDTAWFLSASDTSESWVAAPIVDVGSAGGGRCAALAPASGLESLAASSPRVAVTVAGGPALLASALGVPIRITRPVRYSVYRASDGGWYLGERDWNAGLARFNSIQPIAGPFSSAASGGIRFTFVDSSGSTMPSPVAAPARIAGVRIQARGQTPHDVRALVRGGASGPRTDSLTTIVALRGGR